MSTNTSIPGAALDDSVIPSAVLSDSDWQSVTEYLPELARLAGMREQLRTMIFVSGGDVPPDGLYVVLAGQVCCLSQDKEIATLTPHDYFFEELIALPELAPQYRAVAAPGTTLLRLAEEKSRLLPADSLGSLKRLLFIGDLVGVHMHDFQQPINCCNITAVAFALTALGYPTSIDDLFLGCKLPSAYVVNDGMTLGEVFNVACIYLHQKGLKDEINVQCYYFDEHSVSREHLAAALLESELEGSDHDILVANFGVGLARNIPNNNGGHFALIAKFNPSSGLIHMVDVHPKKYGKLWVTNLDRLHQAMVQRDSSSHRSRGVLRFTKNRALTSTLDSLERHAIQADLSDHLELAEHTLASFYRDSTTNLNSVSTLTCALRLLGETRAETDHLMHRLQVRYTDLLAQVPTPEMLADLTGSYLQALGATDLSGHLARFSRDRQPQETVEAFFARHLATVSRSAGIQMLLNIDINVLMGGAAVELPSAQYSETAVLKQFWCVCIDHDQASHLVTIADSSVATSLVWQTSADRLLAALEDREDPALLMLRKIAFPDN
jgi:hypothetical protein